MNIYVRGNPINLVRRFWTINPLTGGAVLTDPTTVVYTVVNPEGATVVNVTWPGDPSITHAGTGIFVCLIPPELPIGTYRYTCIGTGAVESQAQGDFEIVDSSTQVPDRPEVAVEGPCYPWISGADVANCAAVDIDQQLAPVFDTVAFEASGILYELSGRKYPGVCSATVRPSSQKCCHWGGPDSYGFGPFWWTGTPWGAGFAGWWWMNEYGDKFGCSPMSRVRLSGYPVNDIQSVMIDGALLPEFDSVSGARNWRLDQRRWLTRMNTPPIPPAITSSPNFWPGCQDMGLDADQPGTFEIVYTWGQDAPQIGKDAAVQLANQLYLLCNGQDCVLPVGADRIVRQGIEIDRTLLANLLGDLKGKGTGLLALDAFLAAYCQGQLGHRRSAVWSPDQQQFARRLGQ